MLEWNETPEQTMFGSLNLERRYCNVHLMSGIVWKSKIKTKGYYMSNPSLYKMEESVFLFLNSVWCTVMIQEAGVTRVLCDYMMLDGVAGV